MDWSDVDHEIHLEETDTIDVYTTWQHCQPCRLWHFQWQYDKTSKNRWACWAVAVATKKKVKSGHGLFGLLQWLICMVQINGDYQWCDFILTTCNKHAKSNQYTTPLSSSIILPWFYYSQTFWMWSTWTNCKTYSRQMIYHGRKVPAILIMQSHEQ